MPARAIVGVEFPGDALGGLNIGHARLNMHNYYPINQLITTIIFFLLRLIEPSMPNSLNIFSSDSSALIIPFFIMDLPLIIKYSVEEPNTL